MKKFLPIAIFVCLLTSALFGGGHSPGGSLKQPHRREVAITFDDLPVASVTRQDIETYRSVTTKLLKSTTSDKIPAIGFVNEGKLRGNGATYPARAALLEMWLDA